MLYIEKNIKTDVIDIVEKNSNTFLSDGLKLDLYFLEKSEDTSNERLELTKKVDRKKVDRMTHEDIGV